MMLSLEYNYFVTWSRVTIVQCQNIISYTFYTSIKYCKLKIWKIFVIINMEH